MQMIFSKSYNVGHVTVNDANDNVVHMLVYHTQLFVQQGDPVNNNESNTESQAFFRGIRWWPVD